MPDSPGLLFHLDLHTGIPAYLQLVQQIKHAMRLGLLQVGDQLPPVREVVTQIVINPNTVFKAYRELEHEHLVESRPGLGTFVTGTLAEITPEAYAGLHGQLIAWLQQAQQAGLSHEGLMALIASTLTEFEEAPIA
jgi:GntR family transcriptional regulator